MQHWAQFAVDRKSSYFSCFSMISKISRHCVKHCVKVKQYLSTYLEIILPYSLFHMSKYIN